MANSLPLSNVDPHGSALSECQGDCDNDGNCIGDLKCYQRNEGGPIPPGCTGTPDPSNVWDYCYDARPSNYPWLFDVDCGQYVCDNLLECQGVCMEDEDCVGSLTCYHQQNIFNPKPIPPGCVGIPSPVSHYCYDASNWKYEYHPWLFDVECGGECDNLLECQGDCDGDVDCVGHLKCYQRNFLGSPTPPGCSGTPTGGYDYCYDPIKYQWLPIWNKDINGKNLKECQGDCDEDDDCVGALKCFQRAGDWPESPDPPGCKGMPTTGWDYCYDPNSEPWIDLKTVFIYEDYLPEAPFLFECHADCHVNADCYGNLKCYSRRYKTSPPPPGCSGTPDSSYDYCYDPTKGLPPLLAWAEDKGTPGALLFECEGDCDIDTDCLDDLKCYQRNLGGPIPPGCAGIPTGEYDYCYDENSDPWLFDVECGGDCDNLLECEGDCDEDVDCVGNLKCYQRNLGDPIPPGCVGIPTGEYDYCYDASYSVPLFGFYFHSMTVVVVGILMVLVVSVVINIYFGYGWWKNRMYTKVSKQDIVPETDL